MACRRCGAAVAVSPAAADRIAVAVAGRVSRVPAFPAALARRECPTGPHMSLAKAFRPGRAGGTRQWCRDARARFRARGTRRTMRYRRSCRHCSRWQSRAKGTAKGTAEVDREPALGPAAPAIARGVEAQGRLRLASGQFEPGKLTLHPPGIVGPLARRLRVRSSLA